MPRPRLNLIIVLSLAALGGCKHSVKDRLQGRWVGERADNFPPTQADRVGGWIEGTAFQFEGSRVTVVIPAESPRQGTFSARQSGDELLVSFLRPTGASDEVAFQLEGEDRLRWKLGDGRSVVLRKVDD